MPAEIRFFGKQMSILRNSLAYVIFFLGVWSTTKLPIMLFEIASLGFKFTFLHIGVSLPLYLITAYFIEKITSPESLASLRERAENF